MAIDRRVSQQDLSWFLDLDRQKKLNLNPAYQRRGVWMPKDKKFFLDTILNNYPCPAIYLQKETDKNYLTTYDVVDGKQRLMTVIDFYNDKIRLPDNLGDERLDNKKWSEIEDDGIKKRFVNYSFTVEMLDSIDYEGWNEVFDRLNRNSKTLSHQELRHARFNGWLINRAEQEAEQPFWKMIKISSTAKARRMKDVEFISILMLVLLERKIVGFPQSALDRLYEKYEVKQEMEEEGYFEQESFESQYEENNESQLNFDKQVGSYTVSIDDIDNFEKLFNNIKTFITNLNTISDVLTENKIFGAKRTTHVYTLWTYLTLKKIPDDIKAFIRKYEELFALFETLKVTDEGKWSEINFDENKKAQAIKYYTNATGPTTEEPQRKARLEALERFLAE